MKKNNAMRVITMRMITLVTVAIGFMQMTYASTFTVGGSGNNFTISRTGDGTNFAETVHYRTVSLSAYAGQHYTADSGTFLFAPGQTGTNIAVVLKTPTADAYRFQTVNSGETTASDAGYISNPYLTMAATGYYSSNNTAPESFLSAINAELRMTLSMQVKEVNDGYQYIQVLFDNTTSCDDRSGCKDGNPGNISLARDAVVAA